MFSLTNYVFLDAPYWSHKDTRVLWLWILFIIHLNITYNTYEEKEAVLKNWSINTLVDCSLSYSFPFVQLNLNCSSLHDLTIFSSIVPAILALILALYSMQSIFFLYNDRLQREAKTLIKRSWIFYLPAFFYYPLHFSYHSPIQSRKSIRHNTLFSSFSK